MGQFRFRNWNYVWNWVMHSHKFITIEPGKTSLLRFWGKLSTMSSALCVVWENYGRLWINLEIKAEWQLSWTMVALCNDQIKKRWHESLNIRGQHMPNNIRNDEICDLERILYLIPLENLSWIIFNIISQWDWKTNAASLSWNSDSICSIRWESVDHSHGELSHFLC